MRKFESFFIVLGAGALLFGILSAVLALFGVV